MEPALHRVTADELPALKDWLENYLPDSRKPFRSKLISRCFPHIEQDPVGSGGAEKLKSPTGSGGAEKLKSPTGSGGAEKLKSPTGSGGAEKLKSPTGSGGAEKLKSPTGSGGAEKLKSPTGSGGAEKLKSPTGSGGAEKLKSPTGSGGAEMLKSPTVSGGAEMLKSPTGSGGAEMLKSPTHPLAEPNVPVLTRTPPLYFTVLWTIKGKWRGTSFYSLGWPNILAVGEGLITPEESDCSAYHTDPRTTHVYSPDPSHAEALLTYPGFLDWTKPIFFQAETNKLRETIRKVSTAKGGNLIVFANMMVEAEAEDMPASPVPEGFELRALDPGQHSDFVVGTWPMRRQHSFVYVRELLKSFPTVGLFNKATGQCVGYELMYEYGAVGMLFVMEEFRGRGFGKVITTQLAQNYFREGHSVAAWVIKSNAPSMRMHFDSGFKEKTPFDFIVHHVGSQADYFKKHGYAITSWSQ
ncbi:hypothetical protein RRG08_056944 [Elysia crispata]|uniref:Glycine N-acyltransferase-like protein n=1 Tax=Elysia crispata TaxID=231223 RepID=A0AAE0Y598_9GAST|nr:hypothetical protein RRG08_056944 [Elysia crispata]